MIDVKKYEGHLTGDDDRQTQTWRWTKWMLNNAETVEVLEATANLLRDAPLLLAEVIRLRDIAKICLDAIEEGGDMRTGTVELIEHNLKLMVVIE